MCCRLTFYGSNRKTTGELMCLINDYCQESELLLNIANGDESSFRKLYDLYRNKIYTVAFKVTKSSEVAEDVIQEIFIVIWLKRSELPEIENFGAWLNTIVRRQLYNRFRKIAIEGTYVQYIMKSNQLQLGDHVTDPAIKAEINKIYHEALGRLTPQQRNVYLLGKQEGLKYEEIAEQLHISKHTVKEYMVNAMRSLRDYMTSHDYSLVIVVTFLVAGRM